MENFEESLSLVESLDSFAYPDVQKSIIDSSYVEVYPSTTITQNTPIIFEYIIPNGDWVDLSNIWIKTKIKLKHNVETVVPDDTHVAPICYPALTVYKTIKFFINETLVEHITDHHILAYLYCILSTSNEAQNTILASGGYFKLDSNYSSFQGNCFSKLQEMFEKSKVVNCMGRLASGIFDTRHFLPSGTKLRFEMFPTEMEKFVIDFSDTSEVDYEIKGANLEIREVTLTPNLNSALLEKFETNSIKIPCNRVVMRTVYVNEKASGITNSVICRGVQPTRVFCVLLDSTVYFGTSNTNCHGFKHWNVGTCGLRIGNKIIPSNAKNAKAKWDNKDGLDFYHRLFRTVNGNTQASALNNITYEEFMKYACVFSFDNSGTGAHEMQPIKEGTTSLFMTFSKPPYTSLVAVVAIEYQCVLTLTSTGFATFDPSDI